MIVLAGQIRVPERVKADLQAPLETFITAVRNEPGCRAFWFAWDALDPEIMRMYEVFEDAAAFDAHRNAPHVAVWRSVREKLNIPSRDLMRYEIASSEHLT